MFKQNGINKKPTCHNIYQGVTLAGRQRDNKIRKRGLYISEKKNAENVLNQPMELRQM